MTATALPEQLSDAARDFAAGEQQLLIAGERHAAADGRTFETIDPATGRPITTVAQAGAEDVDRAVKAARQAFDQWSQTTGAERARLINRLADAIEQHADELAELEALDNGKPVKLAKLVDVASAAAYFRHFAGWPERITGDVVPVHQPGMLCYTRKEPVGVCGQIIPWNFPLLMAAWKLAPALAAGCATVLKPAEQTPLTALRLGELALDVGIPAGVINVVTGDGESGAALVDHAGIDKVAFTGSTEVGREIGAKAGRALKRVTLELGGKSPNIILPDADIDAGDQGLLPGDLLQHRPGVQRRQPAVRPPRPVRRGRRRALRARGQARNWDRGSIRRLNSAGRLGRAARARALLHRVRDGNRARSSSRAGVRPATAATSSSRRCSPPPTTISRSRARRSSGRCSSRFPTSRSKRSRRAPTTATTGSPRACGPATSSNAHRLAALLKAGSVYINCWGEVDAGVPFGGYKASGIGREHGREGLEAYLETKAVWTKLVS